MGGNFDGTSIFLTVFNHYLVPSTWYHVCTKYLQAAGSDFYWPAQHPMKKDKQLVTSAAKTDAANPIAPMSTTPVGGAFTPACTKKTVQFETTPSELFCAKRIIRCLSIQIYIVLFRYSMQKKACIVKID